MMIVIFIYTKKEIMVILGHDENDESANLM
jgi:hypothetical protein